MDKTKESKLDLVAVLRTAERLGFSEGVDNHFGLRLKIINLVVIS